MIEITFLIFNLALEMISMNNYVDLGSLNEPYSLVRHLLAFSVFNGPRKSQNMASKSKFISKF